MIISFIGAFIYLRKIDANEKIFDFFGIFCAYAKRIKVSGRKKKEKEVDDSKMCKLRTNAARVWFLLLLASVLMSVRVNCDFAVTLSLKSPNRIRYKRNPNMKNTRKERTQRAHTHTHKLPVRG